MKLKMNQAVANGANICRVNIDLMDVSSTYLIHHKKNQSELD